MNANDCRTVRREIDTSELGQRLSGPLEMHLAACAPVRSSELSEHSCVSWWAASSRWRPRLLILFGERSWGRALQEYVAVHYNYASYCPPRYVVENSKPFCCDVGIVGCRLLRRTRSTNLAVASVSNAR